MGELQCRMASLEASLQEERASHSLTRNEASSRHDMWEAELRTKSMLGLKVVELERRCSRQDADLERERRTLVRLEDDKRDLDARLQADTKM